MKQRLKKPLKTAQRPLRVSLEPAYGIALLILLLIIVGGCGWLPGKKEGSKDEDAPAQLTASAQADMANPAMQPTDQQPTTIPGLYPTTIPYLHVIDPQVAPQNDGVMYGFIVENTAPEQAAIDTTYQITFYDAANNQLSTEQLQIPSHMPDQFVGINHKLTDASVAQATKIDVAPVGTTFQPISEMQVQPRFTIENVGFLNEERTIAVGTVRNTTAQNLSNIQISVLAYDTSDQLVGGGYISIASMPANGMQEVQIPLQTNHPPDGGVTMYSTLIDARHIADTGGEIPGTGEPKEGQPATTQVAQTASPAMTTPQTTTGQSPDMQPTQPEEIPPSLPVQEATLVPMGVPQTVSPTPTPTPTFSPTSDPSGSGDGATPTTPAATPTTPTPDSAGGTNPAATTTPTPIPTNTTSPDSLAATNTPVPNDTNTPTHTPTNTHTNTPESNSTNTPTNSPTEANTPTNTPTNTPLPTNTNTPESDTTNTPTNTPEPNSTNTPTPTPDMSLERPSGDCASNAPSEPPNGPEAWMPSTSLAAGDTAHICVWMVLDGSPANGASVSGKYSYIDVRDAVDEDISPIPTDSNGVAKLSFTVPDTLSEVIVSVVVNYNGTTYDISDNMYADRLEVSFTPQ